MAKRQVSLDHSVSWDCPNDECDEYISDSDSSVSQAVNEVYEHRVNCPGCHIEYVIDARSGEVSPD